MGLQGGKKKLVLDTGMGAKKAGHHRHKAAQGIIIAFVNRPLRLVEKAVDHGMFAQQGIGDFHGSRGLSLYCVAAGKKP